MAQSLMRAYFYSPFMFIAKPTRLLLSLSLVCPIVSGQVLFHIDSAKASECVSKACIDVYIQDGQIIIEGHKGSTPTVAPHVRRVNPPRASKPAPKPQSSVSSGAVAKKRVVAARKPQRKVARKVAPVLSLNDRLVKLLPVGSISKEPKANAIVNVPVIYWCDLPAVFTTKVAIIGEVIDVTMRPSFLWSFGDGTFRATTVAGSPYPNQSITHAYSHAGTFAVVMIATWGGSWSQNGVSRAISGKIRKVAVATVRIANAPTRLTQ